MYAMTFSLYSPFQQEKNALPLKFLMESYVEKVNKVFGIELSILVFKFLSNNYTSRGKWLISSISCLNL